MTEADAAKLIAAVEEDSAHEMTVHVGARTVEYRGVKYRVTLPDCARTQLLKGTWDATRILGRRAAEGEGDRREAAVHARLRELSEVRRAVNRRRS